MYLIRETSTALALLSSRNEAAKDVAPQGNGSNSTQPPALSPSAIVGIAIVGAMFFCVAAAAILRYFQRPESQPNEASLYRPESEGQLEHMKQVREFNRAAAAERAQEAREQNDREREKKMMTRVLRGEKMRRGSAMSVAKDKEEWRKKMSMSAMEAGGALAVDEGEGWPLIGAKSRDAVVQRRETLPGGPRDYSDGAYDTSSGSGGGSNGSGGDFEVMDLKGKQPERYGDQPTPEETKRLARSAEQRSRTPQPMQHQQQQTITSVPDYYE